MLNKQNGIYSWYRLIPFASRHAQAVVTSVMLSALKPEAL